MTPKPKTIARDSIVADALSLFEEFRITSLFVVEEERGGLRPVGVIHIHDCAPAR